MYAKQMRWLFVAPERGDVRRKASGIESHRDRGGRESADAGKQVVPEPTRHQRRHLRTPLCGLLNNLVDERLDICLTSADVFCSLD